MTNITNTNMSAAMGIKADALVAAILAGETWAKTLAPGMPFLGASPAATAAGYAPDSAEHRLFVHEAYRGLEKRGGLVTDAAGIILSIGE